MNGNTKMCSGFSKNSLNWFILFKIVTDEFTSLSRELLTYCISPKQLPDYFKGCLQNLTPKLIFNCQQEKLILESCTDGYDKLDLTVLLKILRKLCPEEIKHHLEDLRIIRNELSHLPSTNIETEDFNVWFSKLCIIGRAIEECIIERAIEEHVKRPPCIERTLIAIRESCLQLIAIRESCLQHFHFEDNEDILYVRESTNELGAERINVLPSINSCVSHDSTNPNVEKEALDTTVDCTVKRPHLDGTKKNQTPGRNNNDISQEVFIAPALDRDKDLPQSPAQYRASHKHLDLSQRDTQHKVPQTDINDQGLTPDGDYNPVQDGSSPQKEVIYTFKDYSQADTQERTSHKDIDLAQAATQQHKDSHKNIDPQHRIIDTDNGLAHAATQQSNLNKDLDSKYKTEDRDKGLAHASSQYRHSHKDLDPKYKTKDRDKSLGEATTLLTYSDPQHRTKDRDKCLGQAMSKTGNKDLVQVATLHKISHKELDQDPLHRTKYGDKCLWQAATQHRDPHKDIDPQHRTKDRDKAASQNTDLRKEAELSQTDSHLMSKDRDESLVQTDKYFVQTASSTRHKTFHKTKEQASTQLRTIHKNQDLAIADNWQRDTYSIKSLSERDSKSKNIQKDQIALHEELSQHNDKKSEVLLLKNIRSLKGENPKKIPDQHSNEKFVVEIGPSWKEQRELGQEERLLAKNNCKGDAKDKRTNAYEALGVELRDEESEEFLQIYADMSDKPKEQQKMDFDKDLVILHTEKLIDCQLAQNLLRDLHDNIDVRGELYENVMCPGRGKLDVQPLLHFKYIFVLITPFYKKAILLRYLVHIILLESNRKSKVVPVLMEEWCKCPLELRPIQPLKFYKTFGENSDQNYYPKALRKLFLI